MLTQACVWLHSNIWVTSSTTQEYPDALHFSIIICATLISTARQTMLSRMISPVTETSSLRALLRAERVSDAYRTVSAVQQYLGARVLQITLGPTAFRSESTGFSYIIHYSTDPIRSLLFSNHGFVHRV